VVDVRLEIRLLIRADEERRWIRGHTVDFVAPFFRGLERREAPAEALPQRQHLRILIFEAVDAEIHEAVGLVPGIQALEERERSAARAAVRVPEIEEDDPAFEIAE